jgi:hypothetical protein
MAKAIVVLCDGEMWSETGSTMIVTDEAFIKLLDGDFPKNLDPDKDIIWEMPAS